MQRIAPCRTDVDGTISPLDTRRFLNAIPLLLLSICLTLAGAGQAGAQTATIVMSGEASPDGNGTFISFEVPTVNANGEVAFVASLTGTALGTTDALGIYLASADSINALVRSGNPAPDGNGQFALFAANYSGTNQVVALSDAGTASFGGYLDGTSSPPGDLSGLFTANIADGVTQVVRTGEPAPDGNGTFASDDSTPPGLSFFGIDGSGRVPFFATFDGTSGGMMDPPDHHGAFRWEGGLVETLARAGDTVPGSTDIFGDIKLMLGISSNSAGQVAVNAQLFSDPMGGGPPPADLNRLYVTDGTTMEEFARSGVTIVDGNGTLEGIQEFVIGDDGTVAFIGWVGNSDSWLDDVPRLFMTDGSTLTQIAKQGALGPGETEFEWEYFKGFDVNGTHGVAFAASLYRPALPPDNRTSGIFINDGGGITPLLRQGDPAPDGNGTFGDLAGPIQMTSGGGIVFEATLEGTSDPGFDSSGIFFIDPDSEVHTVARAGDPLAGSEIYSAWFLCSTFLNGGDIGRAGLNCINDAGQVPFVAGLASGNQGVFLWQSSGTSGIFSDGFESGSVLGWSASTP